MHCDVMRYHRSPIRSFSFPALSWCTGLQKVTSTMVGCAPLGRNSGSLHRGSLSGCANGGSRSDSSDHLMGASVLPAKSKGSKRQEKARASGLASPDHHEPKQTNPRPLPMPQPGPVVVEVNLCRAERSGLGFSIAGGSDNQIVPGDSGIFVTKLTIGGIAETDARIAVGDRIVQVNEVSLVDVTHAQAVKALKRAGDNVNLIIVKPSPKENEVGVEPHGERVNALEGAQKPIQLVGSEDVVSYASSSSTPIVTASGKGDFQPDPLSSEDKGKGDDSQRSTPKPRGDGEGSSSPKQQSPPLRVSHASGQQQPVLESQVAGLVDYEAAASVSDLITQWPTARLVTLYRSTTGQLGMAAANPSFGLNIVGGDGSEATYISQVQPDKPAGLCKKISVGDRLLAVNGIDVSRHGHEKAAATLRQAEDRVDLVLVHCPEDFTEFQQCFFQQLNAIGQEGMGRAQRRRRHHRGTSGRRHRSSTTCPPQVNTEPPMDGPQSTLSPGSPLCVAVHSDEGNCQQPILMRCLVDYDPSKEGSQVVPKKALVIRSGDLFSVINHEDQEWWQAQKINPVTGQVDSHIGIIPSRTRLERRERIARKHVNFPSKKRTSGCSFTTVSPSVRSTENNNWRARDTFDGRVASVPTLPTNQELRSTEDDSGGQCAVQDECITRLPVLTYNQVTPVQLSFPRPVVILGHMKDRIADELLCGFPDRFGTVVPYTTRPCRPNEVEGREYHFVVSRETMVADIAAQRYLEAGEYRGNLYGTHMDSVFEVASQGLHCLLDVNGPALRRLTSSGLPPVAVLILPDSFPAARQLNNRPARSSERPGHLNSPETAGHTGPSASTDGSAGHVQAKLISLMQNFPTYLTGIVISDDFDEAYERTKELIWENAGPLVWLNITSQSPLC